MGQSVLAITQVKTWRMLSQLSFTVRVSLLMATSTYGLGRKCLSLPKDVTYNISIPEHNNNNNRFMARCPGLTGWASTRRNIHPPTIL